ncbi:MAG: hypothetical protein IT384_18665 [Deltaproteobacteria bacterium]|nr:hypothetical protein [Deltaproteobacteria bacterium]
MIGLLFTELLQLFPELLIKDEEQKRAAKASIAASMGAVLAPLDVSAALACEVKATKELVAITLEDPRDRLSLDAGGDTLAGLLGGSWLEMAKVGGGAAVGAGVGAASGEEDGAAFGLRTGASLLQGDCATILGRAGGAAAGGLAATSLADERSRSEAWRLGVSLGSSIGGGATQALGLASAEQASELRASSLGALAGERPAAPLTASDLQRQGVRALMGEGVGLAAGSLLHLARGPKGRSELTADLGRSRAAGAAVVDLALGPTVESPSSPQRFDVLVLAQEAISRAIAPTAKIASAALEWGAELTLGSALDEARRRAERGDHAALQRVQRLESILNAHHAAASVLGATEGLADALETVNQYRARYALPLLP